MKKYFGKVLFCLAAVFIILFGIMTYKGYDKITNYYNSDYSMLNKNAYVGGDAYNYIINGTYAAACLPYWPQASLFQELYVWQPAFYLL